MKFCKFFFTITFAAYLTVALNQWPDLRKFFLSDAEAREILVPVAPVPKPRFMSKGELKELIIPKARAAGLDPRILFILAGKESGGMWQTNRERWEPKKFGTFRSFFRPGMTEREEQRFSTSYGLFQIILGFHMQLCRIEDFTELFDPEANLDCAIKVWQQKTKEARHKDQTPRQLIRETFLRYNGGGVRAEQYAYEASEAYTDMLFEEVMR